MAEQNPVKLEPAVFVELGDLIIYVQNYFSGPKRDIYFATQEETKEIFDDFSNDVGFIPPRLQVILEGLYAISAKIDGNETFVLFR